VNSEKRCEDEKRSAIVMKLTQTGEERRGEEEMVK
jgi:hypothetical protein